MTEMNLFPQAHHCLMLGDVDDKVEQTRETARRWRQGEFVLAESEVTPIGEPGRPPRPRLVSPRELPKRTTRSKDGRAALIHALCHIEFNAINLAWDAVYRFRGLPTKFYADWIRVADEEAYHFSLLRDYLRTLGHEYGDFDAHNGLWEMAVDTAHDPMVRMALVPRVLEARGLDVTPGIMQRFREAGIMQVVEILGIIQRDEVGHVEIGSYWFHYLCRQRDLEGETVFRDLLSQYMKGRIKGPLDRTARLQAGFTEQELDYLEGVG